MAKFGCHIVQGPRSGYGELVAANPAVCLSLDDGGALQEAKQKSGGYTVTVFRDTSVYLEAPPDFNTATNMTALAQGWYPQLRAKWLQNPADYYTISNEQGGNDETVLTRLVAYEREIMRLANLDGLKVCVLNLAGGSPGDLGLWQRVCMPFIIEAWASKNVYGRHAYGSGDLIDATGNVIPGNPARPFAELGFLRQAGAAGGIVITECGLDAGFGFAGVDRFTAQLTGYERLLRQYPEFVGCCAWTLGNWSEANWQDAIPTLTSYLTANPTPKWTWPATQPPPIDPPPPDPEPTGRVVTTTTANVRRVPSTSGNTPIGTVPAGTEFEQVGESGNWYAVKVWVSKDVADPVDTTPPPPAEFTLANPCQGIPLSVNDPFNTPRSYPGNHEGIDLRATTSSGQPVKILASAAGIVDGIRATDPGTGYGLYVRLRHELPGVKWVTWYCHLSAIATGLQVGQPVNTGHILGTAGSTGNSTGVHLHLTVQKIPGGLSGYVVDNVVDPAPLLGIGSTPPPSTLIDLRRFKIADPDCWRVVRNQHGQQEDVQDMELGGGVFVRRKNDLAEWHKRDNTFFYLIHDTSPAPGTEGIERVYTLYKLGVPGAPKSRIQQAVGETWTEVGTHTVQFRAKDDCRNLAENSGNATNNSTIIRYERNYTFNGYGQNLTFEEVVWERTGGETQIYGRMNGKSCGWIGWQETPTSPITEPVEVHWDRGRLAQEPKRYCSW